MSHATLGCLSLTSGFSADDADVAAAAVLGAIVAESPSFIPDFLPEHGKHSSMTNVFSPILARCSEQAQGLVLTWLCYCLPWW